MGFNIEGSTYYSNNPIDTDLGHGADDPAGPPAGYPSGVYLTAANYNASGQVISLPGSDTAWVTGFQPPEHAGQVQVSWTPANAFSDVGAGVNCVRDSINLGAGTALFTPSVQQPTSSGWNLRFTPNGSNLCTSLKAIRVGQSDGLTTNFQAQVNQFTQSGATLRPLDRVSANDNQGFFYWAQSNSRVTFPTSNILTAANRNTLASPNWTATNGILVADSWTGRKSDGEPWENQVARSNSTGRALWRNLPWNCDTTYLQAFADYVCANATGTVYAEVSNEVWNTGFSVNTQAREEARGRLCFWDNPTVLIDNTSNPKTLTTNDPITHVDIFDGTAGAAERYCEKVCEVSGILKARCTANGKPNAIKMVFAWQNTSATVIAGMLDYIPHGSGGVATLDGTATKTHVDVVSSAPYFGLNAVPPTVPPNLDTLATACRDSIDSVTDTAAAIAAVAVARSKQYACYESGQHMFFNDGAGGELYYNVGDPDTVQDIVQRSSQMGDCYMYYLDRLDHKLPAGSIVNHYANNAGNSGRFGAWGLIEKSIDMELDSTTFRSTRPKATAIKDFIGGARKLQPLAGSMFAGVGATAGTVVGSYKGRTFSSSVSLTGTAASALTIVDPTAEVLQFAVADPSAFTSAGTITGNIVETDARDPLGSRTTAISLPVIATPIWSVATSAPYFTITNNGLTGELVGNPNTDNLLKANTASSSSDKYFDITVNILTGGMTVGMCEPGATSSGVQAFIKYTNGGALVRSDGFTIVSGWATYTTGDQIRFRVKNGKVYAAKWNGSSWVYQNSANPTTETNGVAVTGLTNTMVPCCDIAGLNSKVTLAPTGWP